MKVRLVRPWAVLLLGALPAAGQEKTWPPEEALARTREQAVDVAAARGWPEEVQALRAGAGRGPVAQADGPTEVLSVAADLPGDRNRAGLGGEIVLQLRGLDDLVARTAGGCKGIVLFLDGVHIAATPPVSCDLEQDRLRFMLQRTEESKEAWHWLLGEPRSFLREVDVSVGPTSHESIPTRVQSFALEIVPRRPFALLMGLLLSLLAAFTLLARRTSFLREPFGSPGAGRRAPYSLARCQLAYWSLLVISTYLFLWVATGELDTVNGSTLALMGMGAGTALGSRLLAGPRRTSGTRMKPEAAQSSRGFFLDLVSAPAGVSLYRFQLCLWTLALGCLFVASVWRRLAMPQFSATLLGLMGISSGTYLGAKIPEG